MDNDVRFSERDHDSVSNRSLLLNASESEITDYTERAYLEQYKEINNQIKSKQIKLGEIRERIREFPTNEKNSVELKNLKALASRIANSITKLEQELIDFEATPHLQRVLEREKEMLRKKLKQQEKEAVARYMAEKEKEAEKIMKEWEEKRAEVLKKREQQRIETGNQEKQVSEKPVKKEPIKTEKPLNYVLFQSFLMSLSLLVPLIMLDTPILIICIITFLIFSPLLFKSLKFAMILYITYDIARPILYVCGLIVTVLGKQDFFAIAFYILMALQAWNIIKKLIGTISIIVTILSDRRK